MRESVKKGLMRRGMAMFLTLVMALGLLPGAALADNESGASITLSVVDPKETYTVGETVTVKADVSGLSQDKVYYALEGANQESGYQFLNANSTLTVTGKAAGDVKVTVGTYAALNPGEDGETVMDTLTLTFVEPKAEKWTDKGAYDEVLYNRPAGNWYIYDAADLAALAKKVNDKNSFSGKTVTLAADIDLTGYEWVPIGLNKINYEFQGTFEGNGYTISGLNIETNYVNSGLFGYVKNGTIRNVTVKGTISLAEGTSDAAVYIGGLVGTAYGSSNSIGTKVENCVSDVNITIRGQYPYYLERTTSGVKKSSIRTFILVI